MNSFSLNKIISRLLVRYIPAAGSLWVSKLMLDKHSIDDYAVFALLVSFAALVPVLDLGGGTKAVLVSGEPKQVSKMVFPSFIVIFTLGVTWLVTSNHLVFSIFLLSIPVTLYVIARGNYAIDGADEFNKRTLRFYPLGLVCVIVALHLEARWPIYVAALFVVYFALIAGFRPVYVRNVSRFAYNDGRLTDVIPDAISLKIVLLSAIAFIGVWSNIAYLSLFGTAADVQTYDLVWRILSVTYFAQLYLSHSLPEIVRIVNAKGHHNNAVTLIHYIGLTILLMVVQVVVIALIFPAYAWYFGFAFHWGDVASGLFMCFVFGIFIPINQILLASKRFNELFILLGGSALFSVILKLFLIPSTQNAFLTSSLGYLIAAVGGVITVLRSQATESATTR